MAYRDFWVKHRDKIKQLITLVKELYVIGALNASRSNEKVVTSQALKVITLIEHVNTLLAAFEIRAYAEEGLEILDVSDLEIPDKLPLVFLDASSVIPIHAAFFIERDGDIPGLEIGPPRLGDILFHGFKNTCGVRLKTSDRVLKVDLSRKRSELIGDFKKYLDSAYRSRGIVQDMDRKDIKLQRLNIILPIDDWLEGWQSDHSHWEQDKTRFRSEAWKALEVWRLRRQRKTYREIAQRLDMKASAAKMDFQRAYFLIEGRPYDPEHFRRKTQSVRLPELRKTCDTCPTRPTCKELCPDALLYVEQDWGKKQRLTESESITDSLEEDNDGLPILK